MNTKVIFEILGIEKTTDENVIKNAYRMKLMQTNPEDKPEEFKQLRTAYEKALDYAKNGTDEDVLITSQGFGSSPVGEWLNRVDEVYRTLSRRLDNEEWKSLLADDVCGDLDTAEEAKQGLLQYMMDHYQVKSEVYQVVDEKFGIVENEKELKEGLPAEFVNFMIHKVKDVAGESDFAYEWLEGEPQADYDGFINRLYELERLTYEEKDFEAEKVIREMEAMGIAHPFLELEKMRLILIRQKKSGGYLENREMQQTIEELMERYPSSIRIPLFSGEILWKCGQHERAVEIFKKLEEKNQENQDYLIDKYLAFYEYEQGNINKARHHVHRSLGMLMDEETENFRIKMENEVIEKYQKNAPQTTEDAENYMKACVNTKHDDEVYAFLKGSDFLEELKDGYGYLAQSCFEKKLWDEAVNSAKIWRKKLRIAEKNIKTEDENKSEKEIENNRKKIIQSYIYEARALYAHASEQRESQMKNRSYEEREKPRGRSFIHQAEKAVCQAISILEGDGTMDISVRILYIDIMIEGGKYEKAKVQADEILAVYPQFFLAIARKQKICFELRQAQEVIDLFYQGQEAFFQFKNSQGFESVAQLVSELYMRAAEVFYIFRQYDDMAHILNQAENAGVTSPDIELLSVRLLSVKAQSDEEIHDACRKAEEVLKRFLENNAPDETLADLYYEMALLENSQYNQAYIQNGKDIEYIQNAIETYEKPKQHYAKGCFLMDYRKYREALEEFDVVVKMAEGDDAVYYNMGRCHRFLGDDNEAIRLFKKVIELVPNHERAHGELSYVYSGLMSREHGKKYSREYAELALVEINKQIGISNGGEHPNLYYYLDRASIYLAMERYTEALEDADRALEIDNENYYAMETEARAFVGMGEYKQALEYINKAIAALKNPQDEVFFYHLAGNICMRMEDYDKAREYFETGLKYVDNKNKFYFYNYLSNLYQRMGDIKKTKMLETKSFQAGGYEKQRNNLELDLLRADYAGFKGKKLQVANLLNRINKFVKMEPDNLKFIDEQAKVNLFFANKREKAKKIWSQMVEIHQNDPVKLWQYTTSILYLMKLYHEEGDLENTEKYGHLFQKVFCNYFRVETMEEAAEKCDKSLYNSITRYYELGLYWLCMGNMELAWKYCRMMEGRSLCRHCDLSGCTDYYELLGMLYEEEHNIEKAKEAYQKACRYDALNEYTQWKLRNLY